MRSIPTISPFPGLVENPNRHPSKADLQAAFAALAVEGLIIRPKSRLSKSTQRAIERMLIGLGKSINERREMP